MILLKKVIFMVSLAWNTAKRLLDILLFLEKIWTNNLKIFYGFCHEEKINIFNGHFTLRIVMYTPQEIVE